MRLMAMIPPGTNARSIFSDMLRGGQLAGHEVLFEDIALFIAQIEAIRKGMTGQVAPTDPRAARLNELQTGYAKYLESLARLRRIDAVVCLGLDPIMALPWGKRPDGHEGSFLEAAGIPVVHFWLDAPFWAYGGQALGIMNRDRLAGPGHIHVINNEGSAAEMRRVLGFQSVLVQPYGVDEVTFRPWTEMPVPRTHELAVCIGAGDEAPTDTMRAQLDKDVPDVGAIRCDQVERARAKLATILTESGRAGGASVEGAEGLARAWLDEQARDPDRGMMDKFEAATRSAAVATDGITGLADAIISRAGCASAWAQAAALVRSVDSWQRAFYTTYLSQRYRTITIGGGGQALQKSGWPVRADMTGFMGYHELSAAYGRASVAVNVMRYQDDVGVNPKVLEIGASGAAGIMRSRSGLDEAFAEGFEFVFCQTPGEASEKIRALLGNDAKRVGMASAARQRVLREHTWKSRAGQMFAHVESLIRG
ncbi:MAG: glycosyltransferase family 1 protein [Phycisphaerae bacterium]|nr:glycosyltransferase family 1 protein [Phycisphaerae bacterium]